MVCEPIGCEMATIAEFSVPTESFALAETLPRYPDVAVEVDRIAAHVATTSMPCVWATTADSPEFTEAVASDMTVESLHATAQFDDVCLYHIEWSDEINRLIAKMIDHEGVILEAAGRDEHWRLRIRFMTRDQLEAFQRYFTEHGPALHLEQLFVPKHPRQTRGNVTPEQYEALTVAVELGYFHVPRSASIRDLATHLGISHQAVSERLRRGTENIVQDILFFEPIQDRT